MREIEKRLTIINGELGQIKTEISWIKKIISYMAIILTGIMVKSLTGG